MMRDRSSSSHPGNDDTSDTSTSATAERAAKRRRRTTSSTKKPHTELGLMRSDTGYNAASFVGSASGIHFVRSVYNTLRNNQVGAAVEGETPDDSVVPGEDDQLHNIAPVSEPRPLWNENEFESDDSNDNEFKFSFNDLVAWTRSYFDNWHPCFPFLHAPSILDLLDKISQSGFQSINPFEQSIVRSIISIGLADRRQQAPSFAEPVPAILIFRSFDESLLSLQVALCKPTSLTSIQAAVCVQLFLVSMLRHNAASRVGGLIIQLAFHLGLHRCPTRYPSFSADEKQLRRRLFWSIYCLDRYLSQSLGIPISIRDDDVDVCYPDKEHHSKTPGTTSYLDGRLRMLNFLAKHAKIRGLIIELRNVSILKRQDDPDQAASINALLSKWWNEVEDSIEDNLYTFDGTTSPERGTALDPSINSEATSLSPLHKLILIILKHESVISLNRPLIASPRKTPAHAAALHTCIGASKSIITTLRRFLIAEDRRRTSDGKLDGSEIKSTALIWPSFTWAVWMSSFILIHASTEGEFAAEAALRNINHSLDILKQLSLRGSVWPNACAAAITDLRHVLQMRQVKALRQGEPSDKNGSRNAQQGETASSSMSPTKDKSATSPNALRSQTPSTQLGTSWIQSPSNITNGNPPHNFVRDDLTGGSSNHQFALPHPNFTQASPRQFPSSIAFASSQHPMPMELSSSGAFAGANYVSLPTNTWASSDMADPSRGLITPSTELLPDPFDAFDIPFWIGQDEYSHLIGDWN